MPKLFLPYSHKKALTSFAVFVLPGQNKKAFTLVEILVVIGIITILSALVITALNPAQLRKSARDTNRKKDVAIISNALEQYYADNNAYPNVGTGGLNCLATIINGTDTNCATSGTPTGTIYLKSVPKTQSTTATEYCYSSLGTTRQGYVVCAPIEAELTTISVGGDGSTTCTPTPPTGVAATDIGLYCIENPF